MSYEELFITHNSKLKTQNFSILPQNLRRVEPRGPARGAEAGGDRNGEEDKGNGSQRARIGRAHIEQDRRHQPRGEKRRADANHDAGTDKAQALRHDHAPHRRRFTAERLVGTVKWVGLEAPDRGTVYAPLVGVRARLRRLWMTSLQR